MPHTRTSFNQDTGFSDIIIPIGAESFHATSGTATLTRDGKGLLNYAVGNSQTCIFMRPLSDLILRSGTNFITQEQFGTAAGVPGISGVAGTSDADAQLAGLPQGNATATQLVPRTTFIAKGLSISDVTLVYTVTGVALTTHTIGLSKTVFGNNVAPVVSDVLANAANGLATAVQAQPYVTKINVASNYLVTDLSEYVIELDTTTASTGTYKLYGGFIHATINFN